MSETLPASTEMIDYVDQHDQALGVGSLGSIQATFQRHRWFFVFIYNDAGEILMLRRSETSEVSPYGWDVPCEGHVAAGEDYHRAALRTLQAQYGIPWETAPLRFFMKQNASLENSMRFIQFYTCGPISGPPEPTDPERSDLHFVRFEDVDAMMEQTPGDAAESLTVAWRAREAIYWQLNTPTEILPAPEQNRKETPAARGTAGLSGAVAGGPVSKEGFAIPADALAGMQMEGSPFMHQNTKEKLERPSVGTIIGGILLLIKYIFLCVVLLIVLMLDMKLYGAPFIGGFVALLFLHELGHVAAALYMKTPVSSVMFFPLFSTISRIYEERRDLWTEGVLACGGPIAGAIGATLCTLAGFALGSSLLLTLGLTGFILNLLILVPVPYMDGNRMCAAVESSFWIMGLLLLAMGQMVIEGQNFMLYVTISLILYLGFNRIITSSSTLEEQAKIYSAIPKKSRIMMAVLFFGLTAFMVAGAKLSIVGLWRLLPAEKTEDISQDSSL
ncbi:MAG: NUDIX domain-containing protein [Candidatus Methylacidiphilales bacterium]|nr:NUDIX domain-containing protein [Candidatus Methylacidiphilales bacterium]